MRTRRRLNLNLYQNVNAEQRRQCPFTSKKFLRSPFAPPRRSRWYTLVHYYRDSKEVKLTLRCILESQKPTTDDRGRTLEHSVAAYAQGDASGPSALHEYDG